MRAAVKAGLGITARPVEMMSSDLRVLGQSDGLPALAETEYHLCRNPQSQNELADVIFDAMESFQKPWRYTAPVEGDDDSVLVDGSLG